MEKTLVILAAGMGSRFGGIKQIEPVGPSGEIISDYNVYNAIKYGFTKVVFIIRKHHHDIFKDEIINKFKDKIEVEFAYQEFDTVKSDIPVPSTREKVLGTAHALLCAKEVVDSSFAIINGDDFYGVDAFKKASVFIDENQNEFDYLCVTYPLEMVGNKDNTVKRGVSFTEDKVIKKIVESEVTYSNGLYNCKPLDGSKEFTVDENKGCSVNFFVFKKSIFNLLEEYYLEFLKAVDEKNEALLPEVITNNLDSGKITLYEETSNSKWLGITYKDDVEDLKKELNILIEREEYPDNLWR